MKQYTKRLFAFVATLMLLSNTLMAEKINTYFKGTFQDTSFVQSALKHAGFEILAEHQIDQAGDLTTIVFTSALLKTAGKQKGKGFAAVMRVLVNKADNEIAITNPRYFMHAFLQNSYDEAVANKILAKINTAFAGLTPSKDGMDADDLAGYHFMIGMPYYDDMEVVAKGSHDDLLAKANAYNGGKNVIFTLDLGAKRTLVGYKIATKTAKFVKKIGTKNAFVLPYLVLIEGDKAQILAAKYYLALTYPSLKMSQFMKIATIPSEIEKECSKAFQ